ncbi:MAG: helix-turn-helix domain-containing protein [Bacteroidota bacterium]
MTFNYHEPATTAFLRLIEQDVNFSWSPFDHDTKPYTIAWNKGAKQVVTVDDVPYEMGSGDMALLVVNQTFSFDRAEDIVAYQFNREFYCIVDHDQEVSCVGFIFYGLPSPMVIKLDDKEMRSFELLHQVFIEEFGNHDNIQGEMLRMLLKRLIIKVTRIAKTQYLQDELPTVDYDLLREFNLLVELHYKKHHQVQDYANLLHKSPKTLSNLFKKAGADSPLKIIRDRIALEGKRLLLYTDLDVAEVAYETGFQEASHFSRFFKKVVGVAPGAFRKK